VHSVAQCVFRADHAVGFDGHLELVEVGALSHASGRHGVSHTADRREAGVHNDATDGLLGIVVAEGANVTRLVAAAGFNANLQVELAAGEVGNHVVGVENGHVVRQIEVAGSHGTHAGLLQAQHDIFTAAFELEDDSLEVQENVHNVFDDAVNLGVFVHDAHDLSFGRSVADHGGQKDAAKGVAERVAVAAFKRLERDDGKVGVLFVDDGFDRGRLQERSIGHCVKIPIQYPRLVTPIRLTVTFKKVP
jgi:hypothetical protein